MLLFLILWNSFAIIPVHCSLVNRPRDSLFFDDPGQRQYQAIFAFVIKRISLEISIIHFYQLCIYFQLTLMQLKSIVFLDNDFLLLITDLNRSFCEQQWRAEKVVRGNNLQATRLI